MGQIIMQIKKCRIQIILEQLNRIPIAQYISHNFSSKLLFKKFLLKYIHKDDIIMFDAEFFNMKYINY